VWIASSENYRGFGPQPVKKVKKSDGKPPGEETDVVSKARQLLSRKKKESMDNKSVAEAPNVFPGLEVNKQLDTDADPTFDQRLDVIRRSALEKKEFEEKKKYQPIDYDAPVSNSEKSSLGLGAKIGIGVAIVGFALVFAIGDLLPSGSGEKQIEQKELTAEDNAKFQAQLQRFEETLKSNPEDLEALEGAAVAHAELGEYSEAASLLEKLTQKSTKDPDAFRLLGDVRYALEDYDGSAVAYRNGIMDSSTGSLEILSGLTNALVAAKKPNEAVQELLAAKDRLRMKQKIQDSNTQVDESSNKSKDFEQVDPVQIDMLLGKAYSDWGHIGDAVAVYDSLIASHPNDFRGYLAKGILLKANGKVGDAERMFIQAKYLAPPKAKALVDRYSGQ
jgi:tetratricopeptide (TPR) repeat protein